MIVFIDRYTEECFFLKKTLQTSGFECEFILFQDFFFAPEKIVPVNEYFIREKEAESYQVKDLYYAFLEITPFWQIRVDGILGAVYDMNRKKAMIYFSEPREKRLVERVEWFSEAGYVYKVDYYNKYGFTCCSVLKDASGAAVLKTYYTSKGEEVISHDLRSGAVTFFENGCVRAVFDSAGDLEKYLYSQVISSGEAMILTSQRQADILSEVDVNHKAKVCVLLNDAREVQQYQEKSSNAYPFCILNNTHTAACKKPADSYAVRICYRSAIDKPLNANGGILILTASDRIEGIESLIASFPITVFHIAANTAVSDKLLALRKYSNVRIYPQISRERLQYLLDTVSFYLDINYGGEIHHAVIQASMHNMLILGFKNTLHNPYYVLEECVFEKGDCEGLITKMHDIIGNKHALQEILDRQNNLINASMDKFVSMSGMRGGI